MLHRYCKQFLDYCQLADFSIRSIQALSARIDEFEAFLITIKIRSVKKITYRHLINFIADYKKNPQSTSESPGSGRSDNPNVSKVEDTAPVK